MSTNFLDLKAALEGQLVAAALGIATQFPGMGYEPTPGTPWCRVTHHEIPLTVESVGSGGLTKFQGIMQVDLFYPRAGGSGPATAKADVLATSFYRANLPANGKSITVYSVEKGAPSEPKSSPQWLHVPVRLFWYCYAQA